MSFGKKVWLLIIGMILNSFLGFILIGFFNLFIGLMFLVGFSYTVYKDAKSRGEEIALVWAIGTALLLIVVLPLYYFQVVRKKPITSELKAPVSTKICPNCRGDLTSYPSDIRHCPYCGNVLPSYRKHCVYCGSGMPSVGIFCPNCGKQQP